MGSFIAGDWIFGGSDEQQDKLKLPEALKQVKTPIANIQSIATPKQSTELIQQIEQTAKVIPFQKPEAIQPTSTSQLNTSNKSNPVTVHNTPQYTFHINASGLDEEKLVQLIKREIANREREEKINLRSALYDYQENAMP